MLGTSARLLRLLTTLQARASWSGRELAERLEVTDRTLRRDVDRLRSLGYPVHSSPGVAGGYSLGAGATLPPLMLDDEEGVAVALGLESAASGSIAGIEAGSQRALAKLEQVLPKKLQRRLKALRSSIVRLADHGPSVQLSAVATLAAACSERLAVRFDYRARDGAVSTRQVEPHRLVHMERRWYLVAWDTHRSDFRTFRVDRVALPIARGKPFVPRSVPDDDVSSYVRRSVSLGGYRHRARVLLHAPLASARERISASWGTLEPVDARRCRLLVGANSLDSLGMWLGSLEFEFEVEEPAQLKRRLLRLSERLTRAAHRR